MREKENRPTIYKIKIQGHLKEAWAEWLNGMLVSVQNLGSNATILVQVPDQAALRGVLNKLWDLNLTLLSVISQDLRDEN